MLIAFRALQGIGAAIMVPGSLAIIAKAYPKKRARPRDRHLGGRLGADDGARPGARRPGAVGFRRRHLAAIFAINLPLGLISIYLLVAKVPADCADGETQRSISAVRRWRRWPSARSPTG